ncbi:hypothetical protein SAMN03080615_03369 [Amphritea atlantica]|uniref:Uncharacterized protein n=1 Tax=Amphritea atlantica TaxID=355243 RepID=A0A1H9K837_9GAMM|nr:hypothetical protein [Amphritea atlantica]SEQ95294.1 hypothetical protein SAMN03080615_03369 [Amphritea atlantica]
MNIIIIGTSNSVMTESYVSALKIYHQVSNISCGRVPFFYHIKTIKQNIELIEKSDLLIIDHYINDINYYHPRLGDFYLEECKDFYRLLSSLNTNILNILFPIRKKLNSQESDYYNFVKNLSKTNKIPLLDLNKFAFKTENYGDDIHLNRKTSFTVGVSLANNLRTLTEKPVHGGSIKKDPYIIFDSHDIAETNNYQKYDFKNSLIDITFSRCTDQIHLNNRVPCKLLSIGYFLAPSRKEEQGISVLNKRFSFSGNLYLHEAIDSFPSFPGDIRITVLNGNYSNTPSFMGREIVDGPFKDADIVELLAKSEIDLEVNPANRSYYDFELPDLNELLLKFEESLTENKSIAISSELVDILRDLAIGIERLNLDKAYELMKLVKHFRPDGVTINSKIKNYESKLKNH